MKTEEGAKIKGPLKGAIGILRGHTGRASRKRRAPCNDHIASGSIAGPLFMETTI